MRAYMPHVLTFLLAFAAVVGYGEFCTWRANRAEAVAAVAAPDQVRSVDGMAGWLVSGAGDASFDGPYVEAGDHEGVAYYTIGSGVDTRYLFKDEGYWWLARSLDWAGADYVSAGADLPGNPWDVQIGPSAPAPNLSEIIDDAGETIEDPVGVLIDEDPDGWWDLTVTVANVSNISERESQDVICAWYTKTEPYTLVAYETETFIAGSKGTAIFNFGRQPEVHGYFLVWGAPLIRVPLVSGTYFEALNVGWVFPNPPRVITLGSRLSGPEITTGSEVAPGAGDRLASYGTLLDVGAVEFATGYTVMQHVEASFASAYTTTIRPGVYAPTSYGVFCPVSAEAATAYSTRGERIEKQVLASYGVMQNLALAEFPTAYTIEGTIGGGPGMLLMALMKD